ncbi:MAG: hypothetical protein AB7G11_02390 [Phycisphaerales bacterium]
MTHYLYPDFLTNEHAYRQSEKAWRAVWDRVDPVARQRDGWRAPRLGTGHPDILDGNPIFSAVSDSRRRGVRVIQREPDPKDSDLVYWISAFSGEESDPKGITELVIDCALSDEALNEAVSMLDTWVRNWMIP